MIFLAQKPNNLVDKTLFKEHTQDVDYTPVLSGLDMMDPPSIIEEVMAKIRKFGENLERKCKVREFRYARMTLGYMDYPGHGYSWTGCVTR